MCGEYCAGKREESSVGQRYLAEYTDAVIMNTLWYDFFTVFISIWFFSCMSCNVSTEMWFFKWNHFNKNNDSNNNNNNKGIMLVGSFNF